MKCGNRKKSKKENPENFDDDLMLFFPSQDGAKNLVATDEAYDEIEVMECKVLRETSRLKS
jgi:hypothetical protein